MNFNIWIDSPDGQKLRDEIEDVALELDCHGDDQFLIVLAKAAFEAGKEIGRQQERTERRGW